MPLYTNEDGTPVTSQSMLKTFSMCPREAFYKYHLRLKPKEHKKPLYRGKWIHALLEAHYNGDDWRPLHEKFSLDYSKLFDEEKEKLGDLPREIKLLMKSYFFHYGDPNMPAEWEVLEAERLIEAELPNGHIFRGKIDLIVDTPFGLYLVDHKTHGKLPNWEFRMFDEQSTLYTWAARQNDIPVEGFIWNYITTEKLPKYPVLKNGSAFYKKSFDAPTTYPAFASAIKEAQAKYGVDTFLADPDDRAMYKAKLAELKNDRWKGPDEIPTSPFFRRDYLQKTDDVIERQLKETVRKSENMHSYDFTDPDAVERDMKSCSGFFCNYKDLSMADFISGDSSRLQKLNYREDDPMAHQTADSDDLG